MALAIRIPAATNTLCHIFVDAEADYVRGADSDILTLYFERSVVIPVYYYFLNPDGRAELGVCALLQTNPPPAEPPSPHGLPNIEGPFRMLASMRGLPGTMKKIGMVMRALREAGIAIEALRQDYWDDIMLLASKRDFRLQTGLALAQIRQRN